MPGGWCRGVLALAVPVAALSLAGCGEPALIPAPTSSETPSPTAAMSPAPAAVTLQDAFVRVVETVRPSVVQIRTDSGLGSGVVYDGGGDIVTNNHVVAGAAAIEVTTSAGKSFTATLVGSFAAGDLAVIRVSGAELPPATFADSSKLEVGMIVLAVGNPLGLQSSVTEGIVSAVDRTVSESGGVSLPDTIQTSAAINPGNSGGALVDLSGRVVGIPTLAAVDPTLGAANGIGFAIPSNTVTDIASQIVANGHVVNSHRAYLGVRTGTAIDRSGAPIGAVVTSVTGGGPADKAGVKAGDLIVAVAGTAVTTTQDLSAALADQKPGDALALDLVTSDGSRKTVTVAVAEVPAG